jgi:hypothetical protein
MANAIASVTDWSPVLKTIWPTDEIQDEFYEKSPFYAMVPKSTDCEGEAMVIPLQYGWTNGRSAKFANAKANKKASKFTKMTVNTSDQFSLFSIDHKTITLSRSKKGAVVAALTRESRSAMKKLKRAIGFQIWENGGGQIGKIAAISTNTVTLTDVRDARNFEVDDTVAVSADDGTGGAGVRAGTLIVTNVNTKTGVITFSANVTTGIAAAIVNDFLFIDGDYGAALYGVASYVTKFDPGVSGVPTSIWGMTRTTFPSRLAGLRVDGTGLLIEEAVKKGLKEASYEDAASVSHIFMAPDNFLDLELSLGTRMRYVDTKIGNVGFTGIRFTAHGGSPVEIYTDPDITTGDVWGITMDSWKFHSAGEFPDFLTLSGQPNLRPEESTNSFEGRIGGYAQLYTDAPGANFYLKVA